MTTEGMKVGKRESERQNWVPAELSSSRSFLKCQAMKVYCFVKGRGMCEHSIINSEHMERLLEDCQSKLGEKFTETSWGERDRPTIILALQETSMVSSGMMSEPIFSWDKANFLILGLL